MEYTNKKSGALRCFRLDLQLFLDTIPQYLLIIVAFTVLFAFNDTMSPLTAVMLFTSVIPMAMTIQRYTAYFQQMVGFSLSRRSFMDGGMIMKLVYMAFAALMCGLAALIMKYIGAFEISFGSETVLTVLTAAFLALLVGSLGDLIGALIQRFNKIGYVLYIVLYLLVFFAIGVISGIMAANGVSISDFNALTLFTIIAAVSLIASGIINLAVRLMLNRVPVR